MPEFASTGDRKMKLLLLASFAVGLTLGCDALPETHASAPPQKSTSEAKPLPSIAPPATKQEETKDSGASSRDNSNRLFQLSSLEKTTISAHRRKLECWVMDTVSKQQEGMMWLTEKDVRDDQGMLFVFADAQPQSFWMQNTLIPLDIIYINEDGKVLNIVHGKPND
jgi:hypothetical protein